VRYISLKDRASKVRLDLLGKEPRAGASFRDFWDGLPEILAARELKILVEKILEARRLKRGVLAMFGAHVVKVGLSHYLIRLMEKKFVTALAANGAAAIHDFELAYCGSTSEDVARHLKKGIFGFARETGDYLNRWARGAARAKRGLGDAIGAAIAGSRFPNRSLSVLARARDLGVPATLHVAIGTDIIYQHPSCDGAAWGEGSLRDFRTLTRVVGGLAGGGVAMNWGSAVLLPEAFLKAVAVGKNLGVSFRNLTTANFDMVNHYRPRMNVLERPTQEPGSMALNFTGHHEILLPLLAHALLEASV